MQRVDRALGLALALLGVAVAWSARTFPNVPGQKLGAGFLPMIVGVALAVCGLALARRSLGSDRYQANGAPGTGPAAGRPRVGAALVIVAAATGYVLIADRLGFLLTAPLLLLVGFRALEVRWASACAWAVAGTLLVHLAFYKLLRVPLPWGVLRPLY